MKIIRTVNGDIAPGDLGITQTARAPHLRYNPGEKRALLPGAGIPHGIKRYRSITRELQDFYAAGGGGMVEATVPGWGRDVRAFQEMSTRSGVHIIACTGFYTQEYIPDFAREGSPQALVEFLLKELQEAWRIPASRPGC